MRSFPTRAVVTSLFGLLTLCVGMKAVVDYCLPTYPTSSKVFPFRVENASQEKLCRNLIEWDSEARINQARIDSKRNMLYQGPGIFEDETGKTSTVLFGRDLQKLTLMLDSIPRNGLYLFQLLVVNIIVALLMGLLAQWLYAGFSGYQIAKDIQAPQSKAPEQDPNEKVLDDFLE